MGTITRKSIQPDTVTVPIENELTILFSESEESKIMEKCYEQFHAHEEKIKIIDVDDLFRVTEKIIENSIKTIESAITSTELHNEKPPNVDDHSFTSPCLLKCISCKMTSGNDPSDIKALKNSTETILAELKEYSWEAKAVLALAAFALEYEELSLLINLLSTQKIQPAATSKQVFKRVSGLWKDPAGLLKSKQPEINALHVLISQKLDVIGCIHRLQQLSEKNDPRDVPSLAKAIKGIPVIVYRSIMTLVACATKVTQLFTSDEKQKPDDHLISGFVNEIKIIFETITGQFQICTRERDEAIDYNKFKKRIDLQTRDSMEVINILKLWVNVLPKSAEKEVDINTELKEMHVVLLFTTLEVSVEEILVLKPIYKNSNCKLVWVPMVKEWNADLLAQRKEKFEKLITPPNQMSSVYTVQYSSTKESLKYIKEEWSCYDVKDGDTASVWMNPQGEVVKKSTTSRHLIHLYKINVLPIQCPDKYQYQSIPKKWMTAAVQKFNAKLISESTKDKTKYILYYGGRDNAWIQNFKQMATTFQRHPHIMKLNISIELVCVGWNAQGTEETGNVEAFWSEIENFFCSSVHKVEVLEEDRTKTKEVQKLFSYKYEIGWAVLCKGSNVVTTGHGSTIYKVLENFETKWKDLLKEESKFESCFIQQHQELPTAYCCCFDFRSEDGYAPDSMQCPICAGTIHKSVIFRYRCCHPQNTTVARA